MIAAHDNGIGIDYSVFDHHAVLGTPPVRMMFNVCAAATSLTIGELTVRGKGSSDVFRVRAAIIWTARAVLGYSMPRIGRAIERDHSSVIYAFNAALELRAGDLEFRNFSWALACYVVREQNRVAEHLDPYAALAAVGGQAAAIYAAADVLAANDPNDEAFQERFA